MPTGKSLFENGYLYQFVNLKSDEYAYGEAGSLILHLESEEFDTYRLYSKKNLKGVSLPANLSLNSTFEQTLINLDIYDIYKSHYKSGEWEIELLNENQENISAHYSGSFGIAEYTSIEEASLVLIYTKKQNENTIVPFCQGVNVYKLKKVSSHY